LNQQLVESALPLLSPTIRQYGAVVARKKAIHIDFKSSLAIDGDD